MSFIRDCGRILLSIATALFGLETLYYGRFVNGLPPIPPFVPQAAPLAYGVGLILVAASALLAFRRLEAWAALTLQLLFFLSVVLLHSWDLHAIVVNATARTRALEPLALAAAFILLTHEAWSGRDDEVRARRRLWFCDPAFATAVFSFCLIVFGVQHFQFAAFIAQLIPAWIPGHLFFAWFTGFAMVSAGFGLWIRPLRMPAAVGMGLMFFLWFVLLHLPRALHARTNGDEWASAFVALGFAGASLVFAPARQGTGSSQLA